MGVFVVERPELQKFLHAVSEFAEIVVYTAGARCDLWTLFLLWLLPLMYVKMDCLFGVRTLLASIHAVLMCTSIRQCRSIC